MIISFTNVIGAIRSLGEAAQVITTNLKMWLGFETSETIGKNIYNGGIIFGVNGGTFTDNGDGTFTVTGDGSPNVGIGVRDFDADYLTVGGTYKFSAQGANTTLAVYNSSFSLLTTGVSSVEFQATTTSIKLYISPTNGVTATYSDVEVRQLTQITPDKSGNNNVGELFTGKALEFDGSTNYVDIDGFQMTGTNATFAFWVNPQRAVPNGFIFDANPSRFLIGFQSNQISVFTGGSSWNNFGTIAVDSYSRIIITCSGTTLKCYVNGVQLGVDETAFSSFDLSSATEANIGSRYNAASSFFEGNISDLQIYNSVWAADDIAYDYANPNKLAIDNPSTSLSVTNLKAYWALSEGDGLVAYDSGTNLEEEEVVNGDFSDGTNDWVGQNANITVVGDELEVTSIVPYGKAVQDITTVVGQRYVLSAKVTAGTVTARLEIYSSPSSGAVGQSVSSGSQQVSLSFVAAATTIQVQLKCQSASLGTAYFSNISLREITASDHGGILNGATYEPAQPRIPQLGMMNWSKGSNLFPYSEDFTEWVINPGTSQVLLAPTEAAPYGQGDVYSIIMQSSESDAYIRYSTTNATLTSSTHSVWVKQSPTGSATHIRITNNNRAAWNTGTSEKIALTSSWQRIETTDAITGNRFTIIGSADASGTQDSDCIGKALIYGAQLVEGSSAGAYRFTDGGATLNSTVIANPTIPTQDIFGNLVRDRLNSFNLDGSGYAEVADDTDLDIGTGDFSVEAWVKFEFKNQGSGFNVIYCNGNEFNDSNTFSLSSNSSSKISFLVNNTSCNSTSTFSLNEWVHVVGTRIQGTNGVKLYINGNTTPEDNATNNNTVTNSFDKTIGYDTHSSRYYNNIISDVRVYSQALTSDEIENNYNAGLSAHTND